MAQIDELLRYLREHKGSDLHLASGLERRIRKTGRLVPIAREQRAAIEEELKAGRLPALVATSSLELGIDMGAVDLVIQVESPGAVSRGLQRIGRAGHGVGQRSSGRLFPKHRGDLLEAAVVVYISGKWKQTELPYSDPGVSPNPLSHHL